MNDALALVTSPEAWLAFVTLSAMEIVLGIDNIVFLAILVGRIPDTRQRERMRKAGLALALVLRLLLLGAISWIMGLTEPLFRVMSNEISGRDLILLGGGLFLIGKSAHEMHAKLEGDDDSMVKPQGSRHAGFLLLAQIGLIDIVFSLDSVITAVGMAQQFAVMAAAMVVAVGVMFAFARSIGEFVERHPTVKILALSFLLLIGVLLVADGLGQHLSKGYVYFAMAFSLGVELLNMRLRAKRARRARAPVKLHGPAVA